MLCAVLPRVMTYYGGDFDLLHNVSANVATSAFSYPCTDSDKAEWAACAGHNKPPGYTPVLQRNICNDTSLLGHTATDYSARECATSCNNHPTCEFFGFSAKSHYCILYGAPCVPRNDSIPGAAAPTYTTYRLQRLNESSVVPVHNKTITDDFKLKVLFEMCDGVFDRAERRLFSGWEATADRFIAKVRPEVAAGRAIGVMLGE